MVESLENNLDSNQVCTVHVFTDQVERATITKNRAKKIRVVIHEIPPYRWPDATIRRYEIFSNFKEELQEDILMHLDADMLFLDNTYTEIIESVKGHDVALVAHPGYWNAKISIRQRIRNLSASRRMKAGAWETRIESSAYVPIEARDIYVCGGIWIGQQEKIIELMSELAVNVERDRESGVEAIWHDESHLNQWASKNRFVQLTPRFCYVSEYKHLRKIKPGILAVTKEKRTR
jgi:hypothetical protein